MSVLLSVCPSVRTYQRTSHWTDFGEIWYWGLFMNIVEKFHILLNIGHFTWRPKYITLLSATLNRHKSTPCEWNGIMLLGQAWRYKHYANASERYVIRTLPILLLYVYKSFIIIIKKQSHTEPLKMIQGQKSKDVELIKVNKYLGQCVCFLW